MDRVSGATARGWVARHVAVARVRDVIPDQRRPDFHHALLSDFLRFPDPVPFWSAEGYQEERLRIITDRKTVGRSLQGESIRELGELDFATIVRSGLQSILDPINRRRLDIEPFNVDPTTAELLDAPIEIQRRKIEQVLVNRRIHDATFRGKVCDPYWTLTDRSSVSRFRPSLSARIMIG